MLIMLYSMFLDEIERCISKPLETSYIFKKNESKFCMMYIVYCQKNQMFDHSMNEHRLYFEVLINKMVKLNTIATVKYNFINLTYLFNL